MISFLMASLGTPSALVNALNMELAPNVFKKAQRSTTISPTQCCREFMA